MEIFTLNFVAFISNLIDLQQFNTIIVLHDQSTRNQINSLIETLQPRYDVAWILASDCYKMEFLKQNLDRHEKTLILTVWQKEIIYQCLVEIYNRGWVDKRSKSLIVSTYLIKSYIKDWLLLHKINAVFVDWSHEEIMITAWNPTSTDKYIEINETDFLSARYSDSKRKYSGVFFQQLQSMRGEKTVSDVSYHVRNMYNVISKDSVPSIDGALIRKIDLIGEAIQSPIEYWVMKDSARENLKRTTRLSLEFFERTYRTLASVQLRNFQFIYGNIHPFMDAKAGSENDITIGMFGIEITNMQYMTYPYGFDDYVIIVENNTTRTATAIQRIFTTPVIYFWMLLILIFVGIRCGLQWYFESSANVVTKRRKCVVMCEDTVQLSCGVVMNAKQIATQFYGHTMLANGATIIPFVAGMFISGLLYGDFLIHSLIPHIDTIEQLERSNLTIYSDLYDNSSRIKNDIVKAQTIDVFDMIQSGNTSYAYIVPESWTCFLDSDQLQRNGRPMFHVVKERFGAVLMVFQTIKWIVRDRMSTIIKRLQEHGFVIHFDRIAEWTTKPTATEMQAKALDESTLVVEAGGLQGIQIACYMYLVGMSCGIVALIVEYFSKRISQ